jgi:hypothetical protein
MVKVGKAKRHIAEGKGVNKSEWKRINEMNAAHTLGQIFPHRLVKLQIKSQIKSKFMLNLARS